MWISRNFSAMPANFTCIELVEEHASLGRPGAGKPFEDSDGIAPAAACGIRLAVGA
jgi:hypothetical protein